jgi:Kef-type K+ transport system membrane component KefB
VVGELFRKVGQPAVIGQMVAGILLGPSFLGTLWPDALRFLFPPDSLGALNLLSQLGIVLFMFIVGMELEAGHLRYQVQTALLVSHAGILFPFFLGAALSLALYRPLAPGDVSFPVFALFIGIAMSITAFPILARILQERNLADSYLGNLAITCAAVGDVTAWCGLALVVAIAKSAGAVTALLPVTLTLLFVGGMFYGVRPWLRRYLHAPETGPEQETRTLHLALALLVVSAWFTETIGIHALFGAFLAGAILPADPGLRAFLREKLTFFGLIFLLPLFFAFTGLRTQIGRLDDLSSWFYALAIIAVATFGKLGGTMLSARWCGLNGPDSFALGSLMNARGLIELIVLNIGYDMGVLSARIFSMMVLMALTTTLMTGPLLSLAEVWRQRGSGKNSVACPESS